MPIRGNSPMATVPPPTTPVEPRDPSNRWPWIALIIGLVIVLAAIGFFVLNRSQTVNISVEGTPTANPVARASSVSPSPPPILVPPTLPASATLAPSPTPVPAPTNTPATPPTPPPAPTQPPPTQTPAQAAATPAPGAPGGTPTSSASAASSPTLFAGQVANAGGLGNTRADFDTAYGPPTGETPEHLVVYRKNNFEYHVGFVTDSNGRAALIVLVPQQNQTLTLEQAQTAAHQLLPKDAQPPNQTPEGNNQFVVERYTSQTLAQALPPDAFSANKGQPGQFLLVYVKEQQGRITRIILGPGNDPNALINQGR